MLASGINSAPAAGPGEGASQNAEAFPLCYQNITPPTALQLSALAESALTVGERRALALLTALQARGWGSDRRSL